MTAEQGWDLLLKALAYLGGGAVVTIAVSAWISKLVADLTIEGHKAKLGQETERLKGELAKDTETHKLRLKKQELLFIKQLEATSAFIELARKIRPGYDWPEKDWDEACQELVPTLRSVEKDLEAFHQKHGPVLVSETRALLKESILLASTNKFAADGAQYGNFSEALKASGDILDKLERIEELLLDSIQK